MPRIDAIDAIELIKTYRPDSKIVNRGLWIVHSCIIDVFEPHHKNRDSSPSAGINVRTGAYNCFTYSDHSISFRRLCEIIGRDYQFEGREPPQPDDEQWLRELRESFGDVQSQPLTLSIYARYHHPYMTRIRGFSDRVLSAAQICYDQYSGRVVIPIFEGGRLIGMQKRVIPGNDVDGEWHQKYETTRGFRKSEHVYHIGDLDRSQPILVFESVMSVMRAWDYGLKNSCAIFGSHLSLRQADILRRFPSIILWLDGDESGQRGVSDAERTLAGDSLYVVDSSMLGTRDIADIPKDVALTLLSHAMTPTEMALSKVR